MKETKMATQGQGNSKMKKHKMQDRLSALPDELLHHILSFLDMKIAVQTSVLSRRWRYLWHTLSFLHFNSESFESFSFFEDFVCNVLSHRQSYREVLVLSLECDCYLIDWSIVDDILDYVVPLGIQYLRIGSECVVDLTKLSSGDSSTALKLNYMKTRTWNPDILKTTEPVKFELFSLKKLSLANCAFGGFGEDNFDPFRGCVNLQTLVIENCVIIGDSKWFEISAPRLMDFSLYWMDQDRGTKPDSVIVLSTPNLTSFSYVNSKLYEFSINVDLPCMEQVIVGVYILRELKYIPEGTLETTVQGLATLFKKMGKAKIFSTCSETIDVLFKAPLQLENFSCPFPALSTLKIEVPNKVHSFIVPKSVKAYLIGENHDLKTVEEYPGLLTFSVLPTSHFMGDLERKDVDEDVAEECP